MVSILHAVGIETLMRVAVVGHVVSTVVSFLDELGHQSVLLKSDNEPSVTALTHEVSRRRQADIRWTAIIEDIPPGNSVVIGVVEHGDYQLGCQCRTLCSSIENRLGVALLPGLLAIAWPARHAVWIHESLRDRTTPQGPTSPRRSVRTL